MDRHPATPSNAWYVPALPPGEPLFPLPPTAPVRPVRIGSRRRAGRIAGSLTALALAAALGSGATLATLGPPATATSAIAGTGTTGASIAAASVATDADEPLVGIIAAAQASIVTITAETQLGSGPTRGTATSTGSGIIVGANGYVLTNAHVISDAGTITVTLLDGAEYAASVIRAEEDDDLALIKVDATDLPTASIAETTSLQVGQVAIAIGSSLGTYPGSVTMGIISAIDREIDLSEGRGQTIHLTDLIQTDAAINQGNSGGALLDASGSVIGITTAIASAAQGVGFAIPIQAAAALLEVAAGSQA